MAELLKTPWPWYVAGPLIGLTVPLLLILGNRSFGISATFRHICAASFPGRIAFFHYEWKQEAWNLFFAAGIILGGAIAAHFLSNPNAVEIDAALAHDLARFGIVNHSGMLPPELISWPSLLTLRGFVLIVVGGFLVGFGTRYAGGCTSGHAIMGLSNLQWPSLVAVICFMIGGFFAANVLIPVILAL